MFARLLWLAAIVAGTLSSAGAQELTLTGRVDLVQEVSGGGEGARVPGAFRRGCPGCAAGTPVKLTLSDGKPTNSCGSDSRRACERWYDGSNAVLTIGTTSWSLGVVDAVIVGDSSGRAGGGVPMIRIQHYQHGSPRDGSTTATFRIGDGLSLKTGRQILDDRGSVVAQTAGALNWLYTPWRPYADTARSRDPWFTVAFMASRDGATTAYVRIAFQSFAAGGPPALAAAATPRACATARAELTTASAERLFRLVEQQPECRSPLVAMACTRVSGVDAYSKTYEDNLAFAMAVPVVPPFPAAPPVGAVSPTGLPGTAVSPADQLRAQAALARAAIADISRAVEFLRAYRDKVFTNVALSALATAIEQEQEEAPCASSAGAVAPPAGPEEDRKKSWIYEDSPKHGPIDRGQASKRPTDGQGTLNTSLPVGASTRRRVGWDASHREIVVLDKTEETDAAVYFHGYVVDFSELRQPAQNALKRAGLFDNRGRVLKDDE